ncbi:GNAT family N-acetyltransferase [Segatella bryantii]|jgi:ribosomal protein S18 acetylase RimI-like enzyme|uniref:N-acetyltransferase n=1 Tax=Segatella bryantii TaxID=77095 RepID=A0ABX4EKN0_SEGBR|nr:GNAT family N-acetyltransferase [Segatella bryantii]MDR4931529.1 GNAT family N-acetyltransferase [Segatella bryantii]OYP55346.1 N-acetyltransferase [Segatella bryantii]UKK81972.1 GNAT family N-acetyltransferase [Segatella bryantii]SEA43687.1 Acetyltransferase (GNAT) family protein [Segatella bryantii]
MKYQISVAEMQDTETLVQFQLAMAQESEGTQLDYVTVREGVKNAIEDESKAIYLIARNEDNEAIGSLMLTTEWSDWNNARYYWIQSVYVHPEFRRQGVFRELFEFARVIAENDNAGALRLYVDKENIVAQKVYQSLGMHDSHYLMYEL